MALYEHIIIVRQDVSAAQVETLAEELSAIITENGGSVEKVEQWGLRTLAYRIKKNRKGHYVLMNIDAPSAAVVEMERLERINEDIIRILTIRVEELEEGPSAMLRTRDERDDRRGRRDDRGGDRRPRRDDRPRDDKPRDGAPRGDAPAKPAEKPAEKPAAEPTGDAA
ncbi:MAG: 30S ribosomal protein S6 [Alphaproteobacteria bacterium]|nr:MAG: 30S ribosomal protein S6 [Alphaproteobacteria bacterium]